MIEGRPIDVGEIALLQVIRYLYQNIICFNHWFGRERDWMDIIG